MTQKIYTGRCRGGPWHGVDMVQEQKAIDVVIAITRPPDLRMPMSAEARPEYRYGTYRYIPGSWIWREA